MPFLCCGNNSAVVEDTHDAATAASSKLKPAENTAVPTSSVPTDNAATTTTTPASLTPVSKPEIAEPKESPKVATEPIITAPPVEVTTAPEPIVPTPPAGTEEVSEPAQQASVPTSTPPPPPAVAGTGKFLSSLIGSNIVLNGKVYPTDSTLNSSAIVVLFYANASDVIDQTKKIEVFVAGYESQTLDIVYIPEKKDDLYISSGAIPATWYCLPKVSATIKKSLKEKFAFTKSPCFIVTNPASDKVIDGTSKSLDKINEIEPTDDDYDTKSYKVFQEWIKDLPMDTDIVGEVELMYEEPIDDDSSESDSDDE
jgi:hypothetical protein